ncbi:hypothetical protein ABZP36_008925 [Zizania latifolia]
MEGAAETACGQLEVALLQIMHRHHNQSLQQRKQTERARMDAVRRATRVADLLVGTVDGGVQELYINESASSLKPARCLQQSRGTGSRLTSGLPPPTQSIQS